MELAPRQIPDAPDCAKSVACGEKHLLVLSLSGLVYAAGDNTEGQLGDSTREASPRLKLIDEISHLPMKSIEAGSFSAAISEDGSNLFLWGTGAFGEFLTPHRVKKIRGET
jgi:alpha-tubulin suppressor-like RCC1 family protein